MNISRIKHIINVLKNVGVSSSLRLLHNEVKRTLFTPNNMRDFTKRLQIEISNVCNLDCVYCKLRENMPNKGIMSKEAFSKILPYIKYLRSVSFCGNAEALVNKQVGSFLHQIKCESPGTYVSIFTNADLLTEKHCRDFIEYGLDSLVFSIDGVDSETVDTFRKKGSLEKVISNISQLQQLKKEMGSRLPIVSATLVMYKSNYEQIPRVLPLLRNLGVWRLNINGLEPYTENLIDEVMWNDPTTFPVVLEVIKESSSIAKELGMELLVANLVPQGGNCVETENPIVLANGDVVPCSVLSYPRPGYFAVSEDNCLVRTENQKKQIVFGNIHQKSLHDIWFDPDYVDFRKKVISKEFPSVCKHCLIKHEFVCVRSEWSLDSVLSELERASSVNVTIP